MSHQMPTPYPQQLISTVTNFEQITALENRLSDLQVKAIERSIIVDDQLFDVEQSINKLRSKLAHTELRLAVLEDCMLASTRQHYSIQCYLICLVMVCAVFATMV